MAACGKKRQMHQRIRPTASTIIYGVFTRSSKRPAIQVYFEYICWKFAERLQDRVNTLLLAVVTVFSVAAYSVCYSNLQLLGST